MRNWAIWNRQTLVFKLFISFLGIILLFSLFNSLSLHLFNRGVQKEVIQYNRLMLHNTAERYRTHLERVKTLLFDIYNSEYTVAFNRQLHAQDRADPEIWKAADVLKVLRPQAFNPMFYLNNLLVYYQTGDIVVEKEGTVGAEMMFSRFYSSKAYPYSYWKGELGRSGGYKLHPEAEFTVSGLNSTAAVPLIPFSFRMPSSDYLVVALLDAKQLQEAFYGTEDDRQFFIRREDGTLLYRSSDALSDADIPSFASGPDYLLANSYYFFAEKDSASDLTYIVAVPTESITSRVRNASLTLFVIFAVSVVIGILASIFFSRQIHRPVKQMVSSILRRDPVQLRSSIQEFDLIHRNLRELMREKETIHREMLGQRSLLTSFRYINKLKAITSDINEWKDIATMEEPFVLVLYQLHFRTQPVSENGLKTDRMAYYIQEYINLVISERMPAAHTFQIENNQILSLIPGERVPEALEEVLGMLITILDRDKAYLLVTVAVSPVFPASSPFSEAYQEVVELARQARPLEENQIIRERRDVPELLLLTVAQEQELYANLQAGNDGFCVSFMERILDSMDRKGRASASSGNWRPGLPRGWPKFSSPTGRTRRPHPGSGSRRPSKTASPWSSSSGFTGSCFIRRLPSSSPVRRSRTPRWRSSWSTSRAVTRMICP
ncbi:AraC family transcriptional regulator [Paenibacillus sp. CC-CFT747]|nr:AraC family transcriptional regulator [Paenibacillus sp. CC-CFT747]